MILSGTPAAKSSDAPVALREWLVLFPTIPASLHMFFIMSPNTFFPTGLTIYHGTAASLGTVSKGLQ